MVTDDRGQLILIGAIAISLILIGLVLVVNTALFTQVVGTEGSVEMTKEAGVAAEEIEDGASAIVHRENVRNTSSAPGNINTSDINDDLDTALRNESMNGAGAYVNVTYLGDSTQGELISQDNGSFDDTGTDIMIPDNDRTEIGYFRFGVDVPASDGGSMRVVINGTSGTEEDMAVNVSGDQVTLNPSSGDSCTVDDAGEFLWIDVSTGFDYTEQCQFELFDRVEGPYTIEFLNGGDVEGKYDIVAKDGSALPCTLPLTGCETAIWSYELRYQYDAEEVTAVTEPGETREVNVYD